MSRRKRHSKLQAIIASALALTILIVIAINNPWSILSILFILALICSGIFGLFTFLTNSEVRRKQKRDFVRVERVRTLPQLSPNDFEIYVGNIYSKLGYTVEITPRSGDGGIDIILRNGSTTSAVQVKHYLKGNVGRPDVQKLVGACLNKFEKMIFVTPGGYSQGAIEYASLHDVQLIDGPRLQKMAIEVSRNN